MCGRKIEARRAYFHGTDSDVPMFQAGFALPLAIGFSLIISVIVLSISGAVSHRINLITALDDRIRAELKTDSAFNRTIFTVLTSTFTPLGLNINPENREDSDFLTKPDQFPAVGLWPLCGREIEIEPGVTVKLQDLAGMISPNFPSQILRDYFAETLHDPDRANQLVDTLSDWQDPDDFQRLQGAESWDYRSAGYGYIPRNSPIQSIDELNMIKGFNSILMEKFRQDMTYWPTLQTNFLTMRDNLLKVFIKDEKQLSQVLELRNSGDLSPALFTAITGIGQSENHIFFPSNRIRVEINVQQGMARDRLTAVIEKQPSIDKPFAILEWTR